MIKEKQCSKCEQTKSVIDFNFQKVGKDDLQRWCRDCQRAYRQTDKGKESERAYRQSEKGKENQRRYHESVGGKQRNSEYAKTSVIKRIQKRYAQSRKGKDTAIRYWQSEKGKAQRKKQKQTLGTKISNRRYEQSEKGKQGKKRRKALRRTNETQAGGSYTPPEWYALCEFYNFHCLMCNQEFPFDKLTVDHVKPVSKGGTSFIWNLQPLCLSCNSRKRAKEIDCRQTLPDWIKRERECYHQLSLF